MLSSLSLLVTPEDMKEGDAIIEALQNNNEATHEE